MAQGKSTSQSPEQIAAQVITAVQADMQKQGLNPVSRGFMTLLSQHIQPLEETPSEVNLTALKKIFEAFGYEYDGLAAMFESALKSQRNQTSKCDPEKPNLDRLDKDLT